MSDPPIMPLATRFGIPSNPVSRELTPAGTSAQSRLFAQVDFRGEMRPIAFVDLMLGSLHIRGETRASRRKSRTARSKNQPPVAHRQFKAKNSGCKGVGPRRQLAVASHRQDGMTLIRRWLERWSGVERGRRGMANEPLQQFAGLLQN